MTRDDVVDAVLERCVRRASDSDLVSHIVRELNIAQEFTFERGSVKPWFLLNVASIEVDATGYKAPLPPNFIDLFEDSPSVLFQNATTTRLQPLERAGRAALEASVTPVNTRNLFDLMEGYLLLARQATEDDVLRILYYQSETLPTGAYGSVGQPDPNRWYVYASDLLIGEVGSIISGTRLRDDKIQARMDSLRTMAWNRLLAETIARTESAAERFMNGSLYPVSGATRTITALS